MKDEGGKKKIVFGECSFMYVWYCVWRKLNFFLILLYDLVIVNLKGWFGWCGVWNIIEYRNKFYVLLLKRNVC